jgi:hypothetical protein
MNFDQGRALSNAGENEDRRSSFSPHGWNGSGWKIGPKVFTRTHWFLLTGSG